MRFRLPKPLHGWRAFAGEVGIIVLGVLIALGAQQLIETLHWRREVAQFRSAVHHEIGVDFGTYAFRIKERGCVERRLGELDAWLASWRSGRPFRLTGPIGVPSSLSLETSAWQGRDANVVAHMPMRERLALGMFYDRFANNEAHRLDERETWLQLGDFDGAIQLDNHDLMRLQGPISRARYRDARIVQNAMNDMRIGRGMGIRPVMEQDFGLVDADFCRSILPPGTKAGT